MSPAFSGRGTPAAASSPRRMAVSSGSSWGTSEVGWIRAIGVDPEFQGHGVGRALGNALLARFRARGVRTVRTLVEWHAGDVIAYFKDLGFDRSRPVALEKALGRAKR